MLLKQLYLREEKEDASGNNQLIASIIREQCKPFLKECGGLVPWRGISTQAASESVKFLKGKEFGIGTVRTDRRPKDSHEVLHKVLNDYFKSKIGIPLRSTSLFVAGDPDNVLSHGVRFAVFPIGDFKYAWSDIIADPTVAFQDQWIDTDNKENLLFNNKDTAKFISSFIKSWDEFTTKTRRDKKYININIFFQLMEDDPSVNGVTKDTIYTYDNGFWPRAIKFYLDKVDPWKFNTGLHEGLALGEHEMMITCDKYYLVRYDLFMDIKKDIFKGI